LLTPARSASSASVNLRDFNCSGCNSLGPDSLLK
jgi:hypothetical protein